MDIFKWKKAPYRRLTRYMGITTSQIISNSTFRLTISHFDNKEKKQKSYDIVDRLSLILRPTKSV